MQRTIISHNPGRWEVQSQAANRIPCLVVTILLLVSPHSSMKSVVAGT